MITVTISETNGRRKWSHNARTKDALIAIIRTMRKHFPQSHNFIPDDVDNASVLFAAVASTPDVEVTGHIWGQFGYRKLLYVKVVFLTFLL